jgi:hypothetical protein
MLYLVYVNVLTNSLDLDLELDLRIVIVDSGLTHGTHWTGRWVGLRAGLDTEARGNILLRRSNHNYPVPSQTQH